MAGPKFYARPAVSLIEVLVVIGLVGVLTAMLLSAVQSSRGAAARAGCANHLHQIGLACAAHHDATGFLPQPFATDDRLPPKVNLPWTNFVLPHLEQEALWRTIPDAHGVAPGFVNPPHVGLATVVKVYTCPADGRLHAPITDDLGITAAYGSYLGVVNDRSAPAAMDYHRRVRLTDVTDGTSQSLLIGERPPPGRRLAGNWYTMFVPSLDFSTGGYFLGLNLPVMWAADEQSCAGGVRFGPGRLDNGCDSLHFWSLHSGGANFVFVDGSVHFLR